MIIEQCSPTLAGLKTANLFPCKYSSREKLWAEIRRFNANYARKGIRMIPVKTKGNHALIYLYRPKKLEADMQNEISLQILLRFGYRGDNPSSRIAELVRRFKENDEFPHEIGLFLGYPPEDVRGFIEHRNEGCKCVGCWKVYGDEQYARKCFENYKKCTRIYREQFAEGKSIERLIVAV
ncbi:MAG: DUF3793 family protein [Oscillospiraceae bacterium]|nr:DUF3793 family protein [Oscillospiraceae bacterium]